MPLTFNAVDLCVVLINEKPWARVKELCRALEYGKTTKAAGVARCLCSKANYAHNWQLSSVVCKPINWPKWDSNKLDLYINEEGMRELLVGSQQPLAKKLAGYMGIKMIGHKYVRKEASTIYAIKKVFEGISMKQQFSIGTYRINLYFSEHKLAIDCDEHDHKGRDIKYEIRQQSFIENQLNCKFIRYNPDAKHFTIQGALNRIFQYIYQKRFS